jgi:hypothetical protein
MEGGGSAGARAPRKESGERPSPPRPPLRRRCAATAPLAPAIGCRGRTAARSGSRISEDCSVVAASAASAGVGARTRRAQQLLPTAAAPPAIYRRRAGSSCACAYALFAPALNSRSNFASRFGFSFSKLRHRARTRASHDKATASQAAACRPTCTARRAVLHARARRIAVRRERKLMHRSLPRPPLRRRPLDGTHVHVVTE